MYILEPWRSPMFALKAAAIMIQAVVRGRLVRSPPSGPTHRATVDTSIVEQIAALQIQLTWRQRKKPPAVIIQHVWRKYTCVKIFKYYRDLIKFRLQGDPRSLLRAINPSEAHGIDRATQVHVRFRLGGATFPPSLYYKVFLHGSLCDICAFAPRDYANNGEWYRRVENNHWRPITNLNLIYDKPKPFHYSHAKREQTRTTKAKRRKQQWQEQVDDLLKWTQALDYDAYLANWATLATSDKPR